MVRHGEGPDPKADMMYPSGLGRVISEITPTRYYPIYIILVLSARKAIASVFAQCQNYRLRDRFHNILLAHSILNQLPQTKLCSYFYPY